MHTNSQVVVAVSNIILEVVCVFMYVECVAEIHLLVDVMV